jgi:hypothetical protein
MKTNIMLATSFSKQFLHFGEIFGRRLEWAAQRANGKIRALPVPNQTPLLCIAQIPDEMMTFIPVVSFLNESGMGRYVVLTEPPINWRLTGNIRVFEAYVAAN